MSTRTEKFQRKPRETSAPGKTDAEAAETVKFSPEEEEVRPAPNVRSE